MDKKTTPGKRVEKKSGTPQSAKTRTWTTAPAKRRCLIENIDSCNALEYAHLVPQATRNPGLVDFFLRLLQQRILNDYFLLQLDKLECAWGMERGTFNIHTRYNLCLRSSFRKFQTFLAPLHFPYFSRRKITAFLIKETGSCFQMTTLLPFSALELFSRNIRYVSISISFLRPCCHDLRQILAGGYIQL